MPTAAISRRVLVTGRVQGIGYRAACADVANGLGVSGTVRNLEDGRVEVVVSGPAGAVNGLIDWCRRGPRGSRVDDVAVYQESSSEGGGNGRFGIVG